MSVGFRVSLYVARAMALCADIRDCIGALGVSAIMSIWMTDTAGDTFCVEIDRAGYLTLRPSCDWIMLDREASIRLCEVILSKYSEIKPLEKKENNTCKMDPADFDF